MEVANHLPRTGGAGTPDASDQAGPSYDVVARRNALVIAKLERLIEGLSTGDMDMTSQAISELQVAVSLTNGQVTSARLKTAEEERKQATDKMLEALKEVNKKITEAQNAPKPDKVVGWITAIAEAIGGILLTAAAVYITVNTGGASAMLVGSAFMMTVSAAMSLANMGAQETGHQVTNVLGETKQANISWDGMVEAIINQQIADETIVVVRKNADGQFVDKNNNIIADPRIGAAAGFIEMDENEFRDWQMGWGMTAGVLMMVGMMLMGAGAAKVAEVLAKSAQGASVATKTMQASKMVTAMRLEAGGEFVSSVASVMQAINGIMNSLMEIKLAKIEKDTEEGRSKVRLYEKTAKQITHMLLMMFTRMESNATHVNDVHKKSSRDIREWSDTSVNIAARIGSTV